MTGGAADNTDTGVSSANSSTERAQRFVDMHLGNDLFVLANPTTVGNAIALVDMGYVALGTSSAALARSMGRSDGCRALTRDEAVAHAVDVHQATTVPVSGDFENGYGDEPAEVAATVRAAIAAGLAGCCIEDATGLDEPAIYDAGLATERIAAGAEAADGHPFVLVARAENHLHGRHDLDDTVARLQAFEQAGASAVYAPGLIEIDDVARVVDSVDVAVNVLVGLPGQSFTLEDLAAVGVRRVSVGSGFERVANRALLQSAASLLRSGGPVGVPFGS